MAHRPRTRRNWCVLWDTTSSARFSRMRIRGRKSLRISTSCSARRRRSLTQQWKAGRSSASDSFARESGGFSEKVEMNMHFLGNLFGEVILGWCVASGIAFAMHSLGPFAQFMPPRPWADCSCVDVRHRLRDGDRAGRRRNADARCDLPRDSVDARGGLRFGLCDQCRSLNSTVGMWSEKMEGQSTIARTRARLNSTIHEANDEHHTPYRHQA